MAPRSGQGSVVKNCRNPKFERRTTEHVRATFEVIARRGCWFIEAQLHWSSGGQTTGHHGPHASKAIAMANIPEATETMLKAFEGVVADNEEIILELTIPK